MAHADLERHLEYQNSESYGTNAQGAGMMGSGGAGMGMAHKNKKHGGMADKIIDKVAKVAKKEF